MYLFLENRNKKINDVRNSIIAVILSISPFPSPSFISICSSGIRNKQLEIIMLADAIIKKTYNAFISVNVFEINPAFI